MAQLATRFDATAHDTEQRDYEELPNGIYELEVEASDVTPTKDGRGTILKTTMVVLRPEDYAKRKLFNNYNLENPNAQAQEIGQRQFASLCRAIGIDSVEDSEDLHFKAFTAKIGLGKPSKDGQYPARAEIKAYYFPDQGNVPEPAIDASQPATKPAAANDNRQAPAAKAAAPAAAGKRPWGSKAA
ncbi:DUF669 domain-containing protein [Pseudaminobacter arsenicus]|uniref:DUF669 domain-containing protein n=1 Tax=Borborobacter arsenicus TaxID=1851146 RepID=A0A432V9X8_9HYPH|nr:DUF669 domain-containing protein [Pseudaminobacter arsenicus]RUM98998.1 DUF669 domain-containing protein [Pseudaminobacter arsenicus]